jgi:hypothetical protein
MTIKYNHPEQVVEVSPKDRERIKRMIDALRRREPWAVKRMAEIDAKLEPAFRERLRAIEDSERITAADLAIIINAR